MAETTSPVWFTAPHRFDVCWYWDGKQSWYAYYHEGCSKLYGSIFIPSQMVAAGYNIITDPRNADLMVEEGL